MRANRLDGCLPNSCLTLLICLQCSGNDIRGVEGDVSRYILYEPGVKDDLISVVFSRQSSSMPSAIKILLEAMNVQSSGMTSFKSLIRVGSQSFLCRHINTVILALKWSSAHWDVKIYKLIVIYASMFTSLINHYGDL